MPPAKLELKFQKQAEKELQRLLSRARRTPGIAGLGPKGAAWRVELALVGTARMKSLNHKYRKMNRPTDVLSFENPEPFRSWGSLGELLICLPVLKRQAKEQGHSDQAELRVLLAHGLLHLLGLDHEKSAAQARRMAQLEARLLGHGKRKSGLIARAR